MNEEHVHPAGFCVPWPGTHFFVRRVHKKGTQIVRKLRTPAGVPFTSANDRQPV